MATVLDSKVPGREKYLCEINKSIYIYSLIILIIKKKIIASHRNSQTISVETDPSKWVTGFPDPEHLKNTETFPTSYLKKGQRMLWVCMQCWMKLYGNSNGYNIPDKLRQKKLSQAKNYAVIIIIKTTKKYVHEAHLCSEKDPRSK